MKILIEIPKEFEQHFKCDRFEDSLRRLNGDAHLLAGQYEKETALMLIGAFKNAMLDTELAEFLTKIGEDECPPEWDKYCCYPWDHCNECWLDWLNNEPLRGNEQ